MLVAFNRCCWLREDEPTKRPRTRWALKNPLGARDCAKRYEHLAGFEVYNGLV